jgi:hypothetical protein
MPKNHPTSETVLAAVAALAQRLGRTPQLSDVAQDPTFPITEGAIYRDFGSWTALLRELDMAPARATYSDEQRLAPLRELSAQMGRTPTSHEYRSGGARPDASVLVARYGTWLAVCSPAGLDPSRKRVAHWLSDDEMIDQLRELAGSSRHLPQRKDAPPTLARLAVQRWGSWDAAADAAGCAHSSLLIAVDVDYLARSLREAARELGCLPTLVKYRAWRKQNQHAAYLELFYQVYTSWQDALQAAGLAASGGRHRGSDEVISSLQDFLAFCRNDGQKATMDGYDAWPHALGAAANIGQRYGTWAAALRQAGATDADITARALRLEAAASDPGVRQSLIAELHAYAGTHEGQAPTADRYRAWPERARHVNAFIKEFGSWNNALDSAGISHASRRRQISDDELLDILSDFLAEHERPTVVAYRRWKGRTADDSVFMRRFGSWLQALEKARERAALVAA